jgi:hypothetical protein
MARTSISVALACALGLVWAAAPVRADWLLLYEKASGRILVVQMLSAAEAEAQLSRPGPRAGTARLHWGSAELPSAATCKVTPQGTVVCDDRPPPMLTVAAPLAGPAAPAGPEDAAGARPPAAAVDGRARVLERVRALPGSEGRDLDLPGR